MCKIASFRIAFSIFFIGLFLTQNLSAQVPKGFNFQGIALDTAGYVVASKPIALRFSIMSDSLGSLVNYQELINSQTDKYGQFTVTIGSGSVISGLFDSIPWSITNQYLKAELDINKSGKFIPVGLSKMFSVPYAIFSEKSNSVNLEDSLFNIKIGTYALSNIASGVQNNAFGHNALSKNTTGSANSAFGNYSLSNHVSGGGNSAFGRLALASDSIGNFNTALGFNAGAYLKTGSSNIFLGSNAGNNIAFDSISNKLIISNSNTTSPLIYGQFDSSVVTINGDLRVTGQLIGSKNINFMTGTNVRDTLVLLDNTDVFQTGDGFWNPIIKLPIPSSSNNFLSKRIKDILLVYCNSSFSFLISSINTDMPNNITLSTGQYALFIYNNSKWLNIGGTQMQSSDNLKDSLQSLKNQVSALNQQYTSLLAQVNSLLSQPIPSTLSNGLMAWYPFNNNATDNSGNGYNGTVFGATLTNDRFGNSNSAYHFDGVAGTHIQTTYPGVLGNTSRSISIWARYPQQAFNANYFLTWGTQTSGINGQSYGIYVSGGGVTQQFVGVDNGGSDVQTTFSSLSDGKWHNYSFVYDNTLGPNITNVKIYIDGVYYANTAFWNTTNINTVANLLMDIGEYSSANLDWRTFQGDLDEIRIYNRVLTQTEITYLATH